MDFKEESLIVKTGFDMPHMELHAETFPLFQTTAFTFNSLNEAKNGYEEMYEGKNFTYIRSINPNRDALGKIVSMLENGEKTEICTAGMGAITTVLFGCLKAGDHAIYSNCCYGESMEVFELILSQLGVASTAVNMADNEAVKAAVRPNTKMIYTETIANPNMVLADVEELGKIAHACGALLVVDNTFTTAIGYKPLDHGADIVVNSMTKFMNGHSDAIQGSITASAEIIKRMHFISGCFGTVGDPFQSWMCMRGIRTMELRVPRQMENAAKLAKFFEKHPHVLKVNHPAVDSYPQRELAKKMFADDYHMTPMMSILVPEDQDKIHEFTKRLNFAHYVPSLGGLRTSYQQPVTSSHRDMPDAERRAVGITPGMLRISVGIENADDLIKDFENALKAFD